MYMRKHATYIILAIFIIQVLILTLGETSYSLIKKIIVEKSTKAYELENIEKNIDDFEDLIHIPPIKNFRNILLKKLNKRQLIIIKIPENILCFYQYSDKKRKLQLIKQFPVAVGRPTRKSPIGEGVIYTKGHIFFRYKYGTNAGKIVQQAHTRNGEEYEMPYDEMFGLYMVVNQADSYVIHSTTEDWKIGMAVSSGCIRMFIPDMLELYPSLKPPIKVVIQYNVFQLEDGMITIYPDIYRKYTSLSLALAEFLEQKNINPYIFDSDKIKKVLYQPLPATISLNEMLHDYFLSKNITYDQIKIKYKDLLENKKITKINDFFVYHK